LSIRQVACHIYKEEIAAIAGAKANGAKPGEQTYMSGFQGAVTSFLETLDEEKMFSLEEKQSEWKKKGYPIDYQRKTAEMSAHSRLQESAESQYKELGMRSVVWEFHENKAGTKLFQL
jgi:hypothetical protein